MNNYYLSFKNEVIEFSKWLEQKRNDLPDARAYFVSVTFDRYRDRYLSLPHKDSHNEPSNDNISRSDVYAGLTRPMPFDDASNAYVSDINRWYLRMLKKVFGGQYRQFQDLHPIAIGWLDEPTPKKMNPLRIGKKLPGEKFPNAHFVLVVPDGPCLHGSSKERFERLFQDGTLDALWRRFNPEGTMDIKYAHHIPGAVDYAAKTAKRKPQLQDHTIMLPFTSWKQAS